MITHTNDRFSARGSMFGREVFTIDYEWLADQDTLVRSLTESISYLNSRNLFVPPGSFSGRILMHGSMPLDRPGIIVSNGGGCFPLSTGYIGNGMADASVNGNVRAAPSAYDIYEAAKYMGSSKGYVLIYNHFMGDYLNNDMAKELLELDGIPSILVPCSDDMFSAPDEPRSERTGLSGMLYLIRIAASCAAKGMNLSEIDAVMQHALSRLSTLTVTLDHKARKIFLGAGFSGEPPAVEIDDAFSIESLARIACDTLSGDLQPRPGEKLYLMVSRLHQTLCEDALILGAQLTKALSEIGPIGHTSVGRYTYLLDDHGFFITLLCADEVLQPLIGEAFHSEGFVV